MTTLSQTSIRLLQLMPQLARGIVVSLQEKLKISKFRGGWDSLFSSNGGPTTWRRINYGAINGLTVIIMVRDPEGSKLIVVIYIVSNLVKTFHDYHDAKFQLYCRCPEF